MIRILLSKIPAIEPSQTVSIDYPLCKVFPINGQYEHPEKQVASRLGHLMCEQIFFDLNMPQQELNTLHQNAYGKWQFKNFPIDFTISHSHERVIVVATDEGKVGVDLEKLRSIPVSTYQDCFTSAEWSTIQKAAYSEDVFFDYWTKKESILKAWGVGLQIPLNNVSIENNIGRIANTEMYGYLSTINIAGYCCCLCTTFKVEKIEADEFVLNAWLTK